MSFLNGFLRINKFETRHVCSLTLGANPLSRSPSPYGGYSATPSYRPFIYDPFCYFFVIDRLIMKRAASFEYSSDEESDALLAAALDEVEQRGGAQPTPLFTFDFTPVGQRRRWRNVVQGQSFHATLHQTRDATPADNIGEALTEALRVAIHRELQTLNAQPHDRVNFSMTAHGFTQAFQSINFAVREFLERSLRLDALLQSLANKLNSNEEFDPQQGFEVLLSVVAMPTPGCGNGKKYNPGRRCLEKVLKKKQSIITIKNQDDLCCARAIVTMWAWCHKDRDGESRALWNTLRQG